MAKIKLEIDTETTELEITRKVQVVTHPKIRVISAISISPTSARCFYKRGKQQ
jgi:hypothetical protein